MTQCSDLFTTDDSANAKLDAQTLAEVLNNNYSSDITTNRTGTSLMTVNGAIGLIGYHVPIAYTSGIAFTTLADRFVTVEEASVSYAILPSSIPFTTTGTWANDSSNFYLVPTTSSGFNSASDQTITGNWQFKHPIQTVYDGTNYADAIYYQQINALNLLKLGDGNDFDGANVNGKLYVDGAETIRRITANTSVYVATTGNDTTGDGTNGSPFATPHKALESIQNWIIDKDVTVTISVAAGVYNFTEKIEMKHPCGENIILQGSGNASPPNTSTNVTRANIESAFDTRFYFDAIDGLVVNNCNVFNVSTLAILSNNPSGTSGVLAIDNSVFNVPDGTFSVDGFNFNLYSQHGKINVSSCTASNAIQINVFCDSGEIKAESFGSTNAVQDGFNTKKLGSIVADNALTANNGRYGVRCTNLSYITALNINCQGNGVRGFDSVHNSFIRRDNATGGQATDASPAIGVEGNNGAWVL